MRASTHASIIVLGLVAFGCSSSPAATDDDDSTTETGGTTGAGGARADGGTGGAKTDASHGTGGTAGKAGTGGGSPGTGGTSTGPLTYTDASSPAPPAQWVNITSSLAGMTSECGNAAAVFASPWVDMIVTGVARNGLFASNDGGDKWTAIGANGISTILNRMTVILFDPAKASTFWESGIYGWETTWTEGVFITEDNGNAFTGYTQMGSQVQSHNDSISVDFSDPARMTMLSGGHEQRPSSGGLFLSIDNGGSFDDIASSLPSDLGFCTNTLVVSKDNLLVGCNSGFGGGSGAIMRSTDVGSTWTKVYTSGVSGQPLLTSDGNIFWAAQSGGLLKSTDKGVTFSVVADGSKAGGRPIELSDKRIAAVANKMVVVSADGGATWKAATTAIPFDTNGIAYNPFRKTFYASHGDCSNNVPSDAYARYGWDYTTN